MGTFINTGLKLNTGSNLGPERQFPWFVKVNSSEALPLYSTSTSGNDSRQELTSVGSASPPVKVDNKARLCQSSPVSSWDH